MLLYPDYSRSIINVTSSVMSYYRAPFEYPTIPQLDAHLNKFYKNVVLIVIEGMGTDMLERNLSSREFLRKYFTRSLTSVFPSTSSATMTSMLTGVSPAEHAWLGRSLFFKEFCRTIDIFTNLDSYTKQSVSIGNAADFVMPYETIFSDIKSSVIDRVQPFTIAPSKVNIPEKGNIHKPAADFYRVCDLITKIAETDQNTFTFVQWNSADEAAHRTGCCTKETAEALKTISDALAEIYGKIKDTLFIITANHGMTDISDELLIDRMYDINECLIMPPFIDGRAMSFFVKPDRRTDFEKAFANHMGHEFMLIPRSEIYSKGLLGSGRIHKKTYDFVGDYMACGVSDITLRYRTLNTKPMGIGRASHGGLTEQEMTVPLIIAPTEQTKEYQQKKIL